MLNKGTFLKMYEAIVLPGGSTKAVAFLGYFSMFDPHMINQIKIWSTCSIGAFIAVLYFCGKNPLQILNYFPKIGDIEISMTSISSLLQTTGLKRIQKYTKKVRKTINLFVHNNPDKDCTLQEFYEKTGILLYMEAINVDDSEVVYFNYRDHPNVLLIEALWATACIPVLFASVKIGGKRYVDGGLYNPIPIEPVLQYKTLAFSLDTKPKDSVMTQIMALVKLQTTLIKKEAIKRHPRLTLLKCISNFDLFDFNKTPDELANEYAYGKSQYNDVLE